MIMFELTRAQYGSIVSENRTRAGESLPTTQDMDLLPRPSGQFSLWDVIAAQFN